MVEVFDLPRPVKASRRPTGLRGASFNNNDRDNLASSNRNTNENRNNNNGFRVVCVVGSVRKVPKPHRRLGEIPGGYRACPVGAKRTPNRRHVPLVTGKIRGARRGE